MKKYYIYKFVDPGVKKHPYIKPNGVVAVIFSNIWRLVFVFRCICVVCNIFTCWSYLFVCYCPADFGVQFYRLISFNHNICKIKKLQLLISHNYQWNMLFISIFFVFMLICRLKVISHDFYTIMDVFLTLFSKLWQYNYLSLVANNSSCYCTHFDQLSFFWYLLVLV